MDPEDVERRYNLLQSYNKRKKPWKDYMLEETFERLTDLSWFMWEVGKRIATRLNRIRGTKGHFWAGRFKSKLIEDDEYLANTMSYVTQNPVRAGLVEKPSSYPWCTSGQIKRALEQGQTPELPPAGYLKNYPAAIRAKIWLESQDKLAQKEQQTRKQKIRYKGLNVEAWQKEMDSGNPSNWSRPTYGSEAFAKRVAAGHFR